MGIRIAAMILAGGKGTRLGGLTKKLAKPAVSYGGKYRIIDFPLSCCANSGINNVGVLTQYESSALNSYIGNGKNWGLNGVNCLTSVLTPKQTEQGSNWFRGTADAIFQNLDWLDALQPEYVLILSGDHIYTMNFDEMVNFHESHNAECTIAVREVPWEEASRFGIVIPDDKGRIVDFKEKPKKPTSNLASMGIYVFSYKTLRRYLMADSNKAESSHDFGKDIIPALLLRKKQVYAYTYNGYWRDVGTISSLHEANMDLLYSGNPEINPYEVQKKTKVFTEDNHYPPQYIGPMAEVKDSLVNQGSQIRGSIHHCVVSSGVIVDEGAKCSNAVLMPDCHIYSGAIVKNAIVGPGEHVHKATPILGDKDDIILFTGGKCNK